MPTPKAYFDTCIQSGRVQNDLPPLEMAAVRSLLKAGAKALRSPAPLRRLRQGSKWLWNKQGVTQKGRGHLITNSRQTGPHSFKGLLPAPRNLVTKSKVSGPFH
jgi:hypothetical protein